MRNSGSILVLKLVMIYEKMGYNNSDRRFDYHCNASFQFPVYSWDNTSAAKIEFF